MSINPIAPAPRLPRWQRLIAFSLPMALFCVLFVSFDASAYPPGQVYVENGRFEQDGQPITLKGVNVEVLEYFTRSDFEDMADEGFNMVRLRVHWASLQPNPPQRVNGSWKRTWDYDALDKVIKYVGFARDAGMQTLIDNHDCRWCTSHGYPAWTGEAAHNSKGKTYGSGHSAWLAYSRDHWTDALRIEHEGAYLAWLARKLDDVDGIIGYEVLNEPQPGDLPQDASTSRLMSDVQHAWAQKIRKNDPERVIFFQTRYGFLPGLQSFRLDRWANLGNVAADLHNGFGARWGNGIFDRPNSDDERDGEFPQRINQNLSWSDSGPYAGTVVAQRLILLERIAELEPHGIPLFVGEWGWGWNVGRVNAGTITGAMCMVGDAKVSWSYRDWSGPRGIYLDNGNRSVWANLVRKAAKSDCPG